MGELLFVARGRAVALFSLAGAAVCLALSAWTAFFETMPGPSPQPWRYGPAVGLILLAAALALARLARGFWSQRTELYERGFVHVARGQPAPALYADLRSISCAVAEDGQSRARTTTLVLQARAGAAVRVVHQSPAARPDPRFEAACCAAARGLASAWEQQLRVRRTIDWLLDETERPLVQISRTGVEARACADDPFEAVPLADLEYELWEGSLTLLKSGRTLAKFDAAAPNVYPGLELLARLDAGVPGRRRFAPAVSP